MLKKCYLLIGCFVLLACGSNKVSKTLTPLEESTYLLVGQGGGVTGEYEEYILRKSGHVYKWDDMNGKATLKGSLGGEKTEKVFQDWMELSIEGGQPPKAGNMNYRILYHSTEKTFFIRWGDNQQMSAEIMSFYKDTFGALRQAE